MTTNFEWPPPGQMISDVPLRLSGSGRNAVSVGWWMFATHQSPLVSGSSFLDSDPGAPAGHSGRPFRSPGLPHGQSRQCRACDQNEASDSKKDHAAFRIRIGGILGRGSRKTIGWCILAAFLGNPICFGSSAVEVFGQRSICVTANRCD